MIIKDQETTLETIGNIQDESQFKMRTSQKAFQILSSLYSDKPLAIVRELGCNAMDSHIASGQPNLPFHVHVPNTLEPWLTIQDFGTGISHENIYEIYSVYFASTKTNTNSQVGMLGLGSKSPFCYSDNFTITSTHNQVKRVYNAYFNQQGMPTISLASQNNTKEANGVAIQIPIKNSDISEFHQAIHKAFRFFNVKPTISGGEVIWLDKADFEGTFWKSYANNLNQSYAVMGGVAYPIDLYKLDDEHYEILRKAGLVIDFKIGELDVTPSRESLMYHDWVIKALNDKIDLVKKDFLVNVENTIKTSANLLDALKALYKLHNDWSFLNSSMIKGTSVKWNKIDITDPRHSVRTIAPDLVSYSKALWGRKRISESTFAQFHNNAEWYFDDTPRGAIKRVLNYVRKHGNSKISVNLVNQNDMKALIKSGFPASIFLPASTLPKIVVSRASGGKNSKPKGLIKLYDFASTWRSTWDGSDFELSKDTPPKYYIIKTSSWCINASNAGILKDSDGERLTNASCKNTLEDMGKFLGVSMNDVKMVSKTNAKHLDDLGSKNFADLVNSKRIKIDRDKIARANRIERNTIHQVIKHKKFQSLSNDNQFKKMILSFKEDLDEVKSIGNIIKHIYIEDDKKTLTFPTKMVEMMYHACSSWQVGVDKVIVALIEEEETAK
jgi:hypothetical protein